MSLEITSIFVFCTLYAFLLLHHSTHQIKYKDRRYTQSIYDDALIWQYEICTMYIYFQGQVESMRKLLLFILLLFFLCIFFHCMPDTCWMLYVWMSFLIVIIVLWLLYNFFLHFITILFMLMYVMPCIVFFIWKTTLNLPVW